MFDVRHYLDEYVSVLRRMDETAVERMAHVLTSAWKSNRSVFCLGNGGSATTASHVATDLVKLTAPLHGRRLRVFALTESMAAITAAANDFAYEEIFVEQMRTFLAPHDVVVGFSTSGSSPNVIRAIEFANEAGAVTLGVTGRDGLLLQQLSHHTLVVQSASVQQIEDAMLVAGHLLCLRVKDLIGVAIEDEPVKKALRSALRAADTAAM